MLGLGYGGRIQETRFCLPPEPGVDPRLEGSEIVSNGTRAVNSRSGVGEVWSKGPPVPSPRLDVSHRSPAGPLVPRGPCPLPRGPHPISCGQSQDKMPLRSQAHTSGRTRSPPPCSAMASRSLSACLVMGSSLPSRTRLSTTGQLLTGRKLLREPKPA